MLSLILISFTLVANSFGANLRSAGGKMKRIKAGEQNIEACRDLSGRRIRTVNEANK